MEFITGNNFKKYCNFILDENGFRQQNITRTKPQTTPIFFVKTDYVDSFFSGSLLPKESFILLTHNSDHSIGHQYIKYLEYPFLKSWYAQNVNLIHPKLIPIPIGIANSEWPHGDVSTLESVILSDLKKNQLMYANFNVNTNYKQRLYCLKFIDNRYIENNVSFQTYLNNTAQAYFSICPLGNGIDSHRIWESLYLKTVPVVEDTYNIRRLQNSLNLPIVIVKEWKELTDLNLNIQLYNNTINSFNPDVLTIENFISL
jgi:hypothetical protein